MSQSIEAQGYRVACVTKTRHPYGGPALTTLTCRYPRFIHAQVLTHRAFSRNAASNRAMPFEAVVEAVQRDPARPLRWESEKRGMVGGQTLGHLEAAHADNIWSTARDLAISAARTLHDYGAHHQIVNRILEPYQWITTIITATEWENFFDLRCADDAQPEIQHLACLMRQVVEGAEFTGDSAEHLPFVTSEEWESHAVTPLLLASAGRCARVSYLQHDGAVDIGRDIALGRRLLRSGHWSPFEHQAWADESLEGNATQLLRWANLRGWLQFRHAPEALKRAQEMVVREPA